MDSDTSARSLLYKVATFPSMVDVSERSAVGLEPVLDDMLRHTPQERELSHPVHLADDETLWALNAQFLQELEIYGLPVATVHIAGRVSDNDGELWYYYVGSAFGTSVIVNSVDSYVQQLLSEAEAGKPEAIKLIVSLYGTFILKSVSVKIAMRHIEFITTLEQNFMEIKEGAA